MLLPKLSQQINEIDARSSMPGSIIEFKKKFNIIEALLFMHLLEKFCSTVCCWFKSEILKTVKPYPSITKNNFHLLMLIEFVELE